jgi:DNA invertase Pin-like site-specific DNA recombinase
MDGFFAKVSHHNHFPIWKNESLQEFTMQINRVRKYSKGRNETPKIASQRRNSVFRPKQIAETLRKMIVQSGIEKITVQKLAREIGVSGGAIYRHFKNKREI